jgi:hypothetical protein
MTNSNCKKCGHLIGDHKVDYWYKSYCINCDCDIFK